MTVPGRVDAALLLLSLDPPPWFARHARAVAEVASWLAAQIAKRVDRVNRPLVEAAALLHDVDKIIPGDDPARRLAHGEGSAAWLALRGHPELAAAVAGHPVIRLADPAWADTWLAVAPLEAQIVAYADKRAGQRLESMAARFAAWDRRYPAGGPGEIPSLAWRHALALEKGVCSAAGTTPHAVGRLAWTGEALRAAQRESNRRAPDHAGRQGDHQAATFGRIPA